MLENISDVPGRLRHDIAGLLTNGGKRLRPALVLLSGRLGNPSEETLLRLAAGIELLHVATLIHDDIIDNASTRRGIASINALYGPKDAVIAGDYLMAKSLTLLHSALPQNHTREFLQGILHVCRSELLQNASKYTVSLSVRKYLRRISGKTAALFMLSCQAGSMEGKLPDEIQQHLRRYSYNLGMAFQMMDDILDITGTGSSLKKPAHQDIKQGIYTLPAILAFREGTQKGAELIRSGQKGKRIKVRHISELIKSTGSVNAAAAFVRHITARGVREIEKIEESNESLCLKNLLTGLSSRTF